MSWLKGALYYSDLVTTVSPTYAKEIKTPEFGYGLDNDLRKIDHKLVGIINGIDYDAYNPEKDKTIPYNFSIKNLKGKMKNKKALQERVGLPQEDVALMGVVTRLDEQKGVQLIVESMDELLKFRKIQLVLLGTGKPYFEKDLKRLSKKYPDKFQAIIHFDSHFAQWIYAGSDFFLMPSAFEPCGLSQLNSLRYGTLPIVHEVGGLVDTVDSYNEFQEQGTGFSFYDFDSITMLNTIDRALTVYYDKPDSFKKIQARAMSINNSWEKSAQEYIEHYKCLVY